MNRGRSLIAPRWVGGGICLFLFGVAFTVNIVTLSWAPFPGKPSNILLKALALDGTAWVSHPLWGGLVRLLARQSIFPVAGGMAIISALCGAFGAAMMGYAMMAAARYRMQLEPSPEILRRETQARWLSGLVAGLYLTFSIPYWIASTRSLPDVFQLLFLWFVLWVYLAYARSGKNRYLGLLGMVYGIGMSEFPSMVFAAPVMLLLLWGRLYRWNRLRDWRPHVLLAVGAGIGLQTYTLHAGWLYRAGLPTQAFPSLWAAFCSIWKMQGQEITSTGNAIGFLLVLCFAWLPWLLLFAMSRRSPWFYEKDQILVRFIFISGFLGILYNAPFSFWNMMGMHALMMVPHVLLASCMGYMAGEFWILGERQMWDSPIRIRLRWASSLFACLFPLFVLGGMVQNWPVADGRPGARMQQAAAAIVSRLEGRELLFTYGYWSAFGYAPLDDAVQLELREQNMPVLVVNLARGLSPVYLNRIAQTFQDPVLRSSMRQGNLDSLLHALMETGEGVEKIAFLDMPQLFQAFGRVVPDGLLYRLEPMESPVKWLELLEQQQPLWTWVGEMTEFPVDARNPSWLFLDVVRYQAAKIANNFGVLLAEEGHPEGAVASFQAARRMVPGHVSALLNILRYLSVLPSDEQKAIKDEWIATVGKLTGNQWSLADRFGYVRDARRWGLRQVVWALSGISPEEEAVLKNQLALVPIPTERLRQVAFIYQQFDALRPPRQRYYATLSQKPDDPVALVLAGRSFLEARDVDLAEAFFMAAQRAGLPEHVLQLDKGVLAWLRGSDAQAIQIMTDLSDQTPEDLRVWTALALWTPPDHPLNQQAVRMLTRFSDRKTEVRMALAWMYLSRWQWEDAQMELEQIIQKDATNIKAWELLIHTAGIRGDHALRQTALRILAGQVPTHPFQYLRASEDAVARKEWEQAEAILNEGLKKERNPDLLHALAVLGMRESKNMERSRALMDEALDAQPFNPVYLCTRCEINLAMGAADSVVKDAALLLSHMPNSAMGRFFLMRAFELKGDQKRAGRLLKQLNTRRDELPHRYQTYLEKRRKSAP
ncbi:MAG: DUF2723 domain-containing protein [Verrucomicrobiota bacterium]|jgi:predicted Zn-dependent protease|nr:DUF2723 domain-containing protein [Verrucomicrobiota bacterium]